MDNVVKVEIDPDIKLDERYTKKMSEYIKDNILITMTMFCDREKCGWRELTWRVWYENGQPIISVKKKC